MVSLPALVFLCDGYVINRRTKNEICRFRRMEPHFSCDGYV